MAIRRKRSLLPPQFNGDSFESKWLERISKDLCIAIFSRVDGLLLLAALYDIAAIRKIMTKTGSPGK